MTYLGEAVARYHRLLESEAYRDLGWAEELTSKMEQRGLTVGGRPVCPFLRPHFITSRQFKSLTRAADSLLSAIRRVQNMAVESPALMARMEMLPAEKMLASINPNYAVHAFTSQLDTHIENGHLTFVEHNADTPAGAAFSEELAELFYETPILTEFRKRFPLAPSGGKRQLLDALLHAYKQSGGAQKAQIAILEFQQPFQQGPPNEYLLLKEYFNAQGHPCQIVTPDQLEYRQGLLRCQDFRIDIIYRKVRVAEFLLRYDLTHPLVRAYRDGKVCVVNSFRSEMSQKKAIFDLLTDDAVTGSFPAAERHAIRDYVPWTRVVRSTKTQYKGQEIDLPEFILRNRERLILKPNDDVSDQTRFIGWQTDDRNWERAVSRAQKTPYVVQERVETAQVLFPMLSYGDLEMREMQVAVHPEVFPDSIACSSWLTAATQSFSTVSGLTPTFVLDGK